MRKIGRLLLLTLMAASVWGNCCEKLYINLDEIVLDFSGIWIESAEGLCAVEGIFLMG